MCVDLWGWTFELSWKTEFLFYDDVKSEQAFSLERVWYNMDTELRYK